MPGPGHIFVLDKAHMDAVFSDESYHPSRAATYLEDSMHNSTATAAAGEQVDGVMAEVSNRGSKQGDLSGHGVVGDNSCHTVGSADSAGLSLYSSTLLLGRHKSGMVTAEYQFEPSVHSGNASQDPSVRLGSVFERSMHGGIEFQGTSVHRGTAYFEGSVRGGSAYERSVHGGGSAHDGTLAQLKE